MTTSIPFLDFGGRGPVLHFAHANAYPPGCYRQFIEPFLAAYRMLAIHHRPLWPGSHPEELTSWDVVADDLLRFFDQQGLAQVIGMGHSLGAVATMLAALKQPQRFRALVLIEPVFLPPAMLQRAAEQPDAAYGMPLVQIALHRRDRWPARQSAFDQWRGKGVFDRWSDAALWDYVNAGLREAEGGDVVLAYAREWEARFYANPPLNVWEQIAQVTQPTLGIRGAESDTILPEAWQLWQARQPQATFVEMAEAGHMVPMERPLRLAAQVQQFLAQHVV